MDAVTTTPAIPPAPPLDPHAAWRAAAEEQTLAFRAWCAAPRTGRRDAYIVFVAAEQRAAAAADALRRRAAA
jgi:hypothetical protein